MYLRVDAKEKLKKGCRQTKLSLCLYLGNQEGTRGKYELSN